MSDDDASPSTDEPGPDAPGPDEQELDGRIRDLLAVPPLDEVTRRRLVGRALDAGSTSAAERRPRSRFAMAVPVAAAIAVGLVIGAVVVTRPEDTTPTASPAESSAPTPQGDGDRAAGADDAPALSESAGIADLGDLGTVASADDLRTTAIVAQERLAAGDTSQGRILPCTESLPDDLGLATIDAAGSATVDDAPVTILLGRAADGVSSAVAVTVDTCAPVLRTTLGSTLPGP